MLPLKKAIELSDYFAQCRCDIDVRGVLVSLLWLYLANSQVSVYRAIGPLVFLILYSFIKTLVPQPSIHQHFPTASPLKL